MGYLICGKCKSYYILESDESAKDFTDKCECGGKLRYVENLDIVDPHWKQVSLRRKPTNTEILKSKIRSLYSFRSLNIKYRLNKLYYNTIGKHIYNARNQQRIHKNPPGMQAGFINSIMNEFNLNNIQWILVIPATIAITLIFIQWILVIPATIAITLIFIQWILVIPATIAITLIFTYSQGISTLLALILLVIIGYLSENMIIGAKNAVITGAISFFLGSLFMGSFLLIIPYAIFGIINGAVCGLIGGYIKTKRFR